MAKLRHFLDIDVLTAAKQRIHHIFDLYDSVVVCFSGGKDSTVVLELAREVAAERGIEKIEALFRDEELIPNQVVDFVDSYRQKPWLNLIWFTVPLESHKFYMGKVIGYVQWDPNREHVRPKPAWGVSLPLGDNRVMSQYSMDEYAASFYPGKVAFLTGIRAEESLIRYRASVNKLNDSYINASASKRVSLCKPIYDWRENDVFRYFYEREIRYCPWYDQQMWAGDSLRVTTPLCSEPAKQYHRSMPVDPEFYDRIMRVFPEMRTQARYWKEFDRESVYEKYGSDGYRGIFNYIDLEIEEEVQKVKAREFVNMCQRRTEIGNSGEYEIRDVLKHVVNGQFRRTYIGGHTNQFNEKASV